MYSIYIYIYIINLYCKVHALLDKCGLCVMAPIATQHAKNQTRHAEGAHQAASVQTEYLFLIKESASSGHSVGVSDVVLSFAIVQFYSITLAERRLRL